MTLPDTSVVNESKTDGTADDSRLTVITSLRRNVAFLDEAMLADRRSSSMLKPASKRVS